MVFKKGHIPFNKGKTKKYLFSLARPNNNFSKLARERAEKINSTRMIGNKYGYIDGRSSEEKYFKNWYQENKEKVKERCKRYGQENPEKVKENRIKW